MQTEEYSAEAIIIGNKPYFAVIISGQFGNLGGVSIILHESISLDTNSDGLIKPPDARSYINKSYTLKSKEEFDRLVEIARNETLDAIQKGEVNMEEIC